MEIKDSKRNLFQRIFGIPVLKPPKDNSFWKLEEGKIEISIEKVPQLLMKGTAVRVEGGPLSERILDIYGEDGEYHALQNNCTHGKRCLDPVPGTKTVQCCSIGKSTFGYDGKILKGSAKQNLKSFPISYFEGKLTIDLE